MISPSMTILPDGRVQVDGGMVADLDDFEALLIRAWNRVLSQRAADTCGVQKCVLGSHPDHPSGHILRGIGVQDRKARAESTLGMR